MAIFGLDISHHQDARLDLARCRQEGIDFVFIKSSEGNTFVDNAFASNVAEAEHAGLLIGAYHYVRDNASAASQVSNVRRVVPLDIPVIPDIEANSGGIQLTRDFINGLRDAGYHVPFLYLPRWYWQQIGSPSLAGLPPLWSSRYPDTVVGSLSSEFASVPASYWNGYGGLEVAILQFTSSVSIAGFSPIDANAYRGTRDQLANQLGGGDMADSPAVIHMGWRMEAVLQEWEKFPTTLDVPEELRGQPTGSYVGDFKVIGSVVKSLSTQVSTLTSKVDTLTSKLDALLGDGIKVVAEGQIILKGMENE